MSDVILKNDPIFSVKELEEGEKLVIPENEQLIIVGNLIIPYGASIIQGNKSFAAQFEVE